MAKPPANDPAGPAAATSADRARQARLAEALRTNLARRKARARAAGSSDPAADEIAD